MNRSFLALILLAAAACDRHDEASAAGDAGDGARSARHAQRVAFVVPDTATIPAGPAGVSIRRGLALATATRDSFPETVRADLRCTSCHLDGGARAGVMPWVGVAARFPQYRARSGAMVSLEERIRGCFSRSLNATAPAHGSRDLVDIAAYLTWLSHGTPMGRETEGQGLPTVEPATPDREQGRHQYVAECSRCHGAQGEGGPSTTPGSAPAPPLWGPRSYNIGAGMARVSIFANFIRAAMPHDRPGTLSAQQAYDIAAYVNAQPRPDFAPKAEDWPNGDAPADAAYPTRAGSKVPTAKHLTRP